MWLVMENDIINLNQVNSISIVRGGVDEGKEWHMVCLRNEAGKPSYKSDDESDLSLFQGTLEECKAFIEQMSACLKSKDRQLIELDYIINMMKGGLKGGSRISLATKAVNLKE